MESRVIAVTGSNKGIGFAIVKLLCQRFPTCVIYLTARNLERGEKAIAELNAVGLYPKFHLLDIDSDDSIKIFKDFLVEIHGGLDVLINNAGIAYWKKSSVPFGEQARVTCGTNYFSTLNVCYQLFPILRSHARVVNVSSRAGHFAFENLSGDLKEAFKRCESTSQVDSLIYKFIESAEHGQHESHGWPSSPYGISKIGLTVVTKFLQEMLDKDSSRCNMIVNSCSPGFVKTDLTCHEGNLTPEEAADTPIYLATLTEDNNYVRGCFVNERVVNNIF